MAFVYRASLLFVAVASETDDALSLLQTAIVKQHKQEQGPKCGVVPTICPEEGKPKTDECPEGCKYIEDCDMCQQAAVFWNLSYGGENNWPNDPRPHGCFRNRKWQIKCNPDGPYGGFRGKWPVCQQICGHPRWVGTDYETTCHAVCTTTTTTTTTTKSYVTVVTTTTKEVKPDPDTTCTGPDCGIIPEVCANATQVFFQMGNLVHNNLGGKGPGGGPPEMKFIRAGVLDSRELDVIVHVKGNYNLGPPSWNTCMSNQAGMIGASQGKYTFQFDIVYHETQEPATVPFLPMTYYDVDANTEWVASCDATAFVLHSPTDIRGTCTGNCCEHKGAVAQVRTPSNFENLDAQQKQAAVTYLYKDVSHFDVTWTLTRSAGGFMFMGSKGMACQMPR